MVTSWLLVLSSLYSICHIPTGRERPWRSTTFYPFDFFILSFFLLSLPFLVLPSIYTNALARLLAVSPVSIYLDMPRECQSFQAFFAHYVSQNCQLSLSSSKCTWPFGFYFLSRCPHMEFSESCSRTMFLLPHITSYIYFFAFVFYSKVYPVKCSGVTRGRNLC